MIFFGWSCGALNVHVTDEHGGIFFQRIGETSCKFHHDVRLPDAIYQDIFMLCPNEPFQSAISAGDFWAGHKNGRFASGCMLDREIFLDFFTPQKVSPTWYKNHLWRLILKFFS